MIIYLQLDWGKGGGGVGKASNGGGLQRSQAAGGRTFPRLPVWLCLLWPGGYLAVTITGGRASNEHRKSEVSPAIETAAVLAKRGRPKKLCRLSIPGNQKEW